MPKSGFRTISFRESLYDWIEADFNKMRLEGRLPPGITSVSGYLTHRIMKNMEESDKLHNIARQIRYIPRKIKEDHV